MTRPVLEMATVAGMAGGTGVALIGSDGSTVVTVVGILLVWVAAAVTLGALYAAWRDGGRS